MNTKLTEAAEKGDVNALRDLMPGNPFLFKPAELAGGQNLLHIACMGGHVDFVKEVLYHRPEFAKELDKDGLSPLHIASAFGLLDTVQELLKVGPHLCLIKGKDGRIPLHYAVVGGNIQVINELLSSCLVSIIEVTNGGETCFHIAVKYNQVEALGYLTSHVKFLYTKETEYVLNMKDDQGNSILHLAASEKQYEVLEFLLLTLKPYLELNSLNRWDLTMLDVLVSQGGCVEIEVKLRQAGAQRAANLWNVILIRKVVDRLMHDRNMTLNLSNDSKNAMLVVTVLIVAATYQATINPPGGVWQDSTVSPSTMDDPSTKAAPHIAGTSVMGTLKPVPFALFLLCNSIGFMGSLAMLFILTPGIPKIREFRLALLSLLVTYYICAVSATSHGSWLPILVSLILLAVLILFVNLVKRSFAT